MDFPSRVTEWADPNDDLIASSRQVEQNNTGTFLLQYLGTVLTNGMNPQAACTSRGSPHNNMDLNPSQESHMFVFDDGRDDVCSHQCSSSSLLSANRQIGGVPLLLNEGPPSCEQRARKFGVPSHNYDCDFADGECVHNEQRLTPKNSVRYLHIPRHSLEEFQSLIREGALDTHGEFAVDNPYVQALVNYRREMQSFAVVPAAATSLEQKLSTQQENLSTLTPVRMTQGISQSAISPTDGFCRCLPRCRSFDRTVGCCGDAFGSSVPTECLRID